MEATRIRLSDGGPIIAITNTIKFIGAPKINVCTGKDNAEIGENMMSVSRLPNPNTSEYVADTNITATPNTYGITIEVITICTRANSMRDFVSVDIFTKSLSVEESYDK